MKSILIISFLLLLGSFGFGQDIHQVDTNTVAVVPYSTLRSNPNKYEGVELSKQEVRQVDSLVSLCMRVNSKSVLDSIYGTDERNFIMDDSYYKQFIPMLNDKQEKTVWVNCFCNYNENNDNWKKRIHLVADGGNCYFTVMVNLSTLSYYDLTINGPHLVKFKEE